MREKKRKEGKNEKKRWRPTRPLRLPRTPQARRRDPRSPAVDARRSSLALDHVRVAVAALLDPLVPLVELHELPDDGALRFVAEEAGLQLCPY